MNAAIVSRFRSVAAALAMALAAAACQSPPPAAPAKPAVAEPDAKPAVAVPVPPKPPPRAPRIGLALGGGAARGFAHIGVIQVLEEAGIRPALVAGTSAGSLVAALYASGKNGTQLAALAASIDEATIADWSFPGRGMIRGEALGRFVREQTGGRAIEQMRIPLGIVATDLGNGTPILFQVGDPGIAVRASSAVPAVFRPVRIGNREYVDGGLVSPVPVRFAREMGAELVIAVDITQSPDGAETGDMMSIVLQTFSIMGRSITHFELRDADIALRPRLNGVASVDFAARSQSIQAGRDAALAALPQIKAKIAALTH